MPKGKWYYTTHLEERYYAAFTIEFHGPEYGSLGLELSWQASKSENGNLDSNLWKEGWSEWYALSIEAKARTTGRWAEINKIVGQITRKWEDGREPGPVEVLEQLGRSVSFTEAQHDFRLHKTLPLDEVPDRDLNRYIDDYEAYDNGAWAYGCRFDCLARDIEEAKVTIASNIARNGHDDVLIRFIEAGKPVRLTYAGNSQEEPLSGLVKLGKALM